MARDVQQALAPLIGPVELGDPYPPDEIFRAPGMAPGDLAVWRGALPALSARYNTLYYNVRLAGQARLTAGRTEASLRMQQMLTARRIDVVGDAGDHWEIIEVKDRSSLSAVGQLLGYQVLWNIHPPDDRPTALIYVTPDLEADVSLVLAQLGIEAIVAAPA